MRSFTFFVSVLFCASVLLAGFHMKIREHTDGYYHHGMNEPEVNLVSEIWIEGEQMAYVRGGLKVIIHLGKKQVLLINMEEKKYVKSTLPLDLSGIADEAYAPILKIYQLHGTLSRSDKSKKIGERSCRGYDQEHWIIYEGERYYETETVAWVSRDFPLKWEKMNAFMEVIFALNNFEESYRKELLGMEGFLVASESVRYADAAAIHSTTELTLFEEIEMESGQFVLPEGFTEKEKLSREDLR